MSRQLEKTARHWDAHHDRDRAMRVQWWDLPAVLRHRNQLLSGDPAIGFEEHTSSRYLATVAGGAQILSLGCGDGILERRLFALGNVRSAIGIDIGEKALVLARERAAAAGIDAEYRYGDLNRIELDPHSFDAVYSAGILHHLSELEHVFDQIHRSLRPGGWLFLDEYVGPNRFQFPVEQRSAIQAAFRSIPAGYRRQTTAPDPGASVVPLQAFGPKLLWSKLRSGRLLDAVRYRLSLLGADSSAPPVLSKPRFPTAEDVAHGDPSEAVRSEDILPLARQRFEVLEERGTGLGLLQFLLADIAGNFTEGRGADVLETLIAKDSDVPDDFVFVAARRR